MARVVLHGTEYIERAEVIALVAAELRAPALAVAVEYDRGVRAGALPFRWDEERLGVVHFTRVATADLRTCIWLIGRGLGLNVKPPRIPRAKKSKVGRRKYPKTKEALTWLARQLGRWKRPHAECSRADWQSQAGMARALQGHAVDQNWPDISDPTAKRLVREALALFDKNRADQN